MSWKHSTLGSHLLCRLPGNFIKLLETRFCACKISCNCLLEEWMWMDLHKWRSLSPLAEQCKPFADSCTVICFSRLKADLRPFLAVSLYLWLSVGLGEVQVKSRGSKWSRHQVIAEFWAAAPWLLCAEAALWCLLLVTVSWWGSFSSSHSLNLSSGLFISSSPMAQRAHDKPWRCWAAGVSTRCCAVASTGGLAG